MREISIFNDLNFYNIKSNIFKSIYYFKDLEFYFINIRKEIENIYDKLEKQIEIKITNMY